jgi:hypothetical protein
VELQNQELFSSTDGGLKVSLVPQFNYVLFMNKSLIFILIKNSFYGSCKLLKPSVCKS